MSYSPEYFENEKSKALKMYKELMREQKNIQAIISDLYSEIKGKGLLFREDILDGSNQDTIKSQFFTIQNKLEDLIFKKELLKKDIAILQYRIKYLDDEISKDKPWWRRFIKVL